MPGDRIRRRVVIRGRVQGVFFRDATSERANARGVDGWIRNCPDGTVEAVLEGPPGAVEEVLAFCRTGPPAARVDRVDVEEQQPVG
ncbi:MAG: acylphosphatase, partial [Candidatus Dormibacteraeota bacterium]|nr:acylphosphatase [Candidatus Dormibacteraeota bacterium]